MTEGEIAGCNCELAKLIKPLIVAIPEETNVTGTLVATPTVYWISRLASSPAYCGPWGFCPPSISWTEKVPLGKSGRKSFKNDYNKR